MHLIETLKTPIYNNKCISKTPIYIFGYILVQKGHVVQQLDMQATLDFAVDFMLLFIFCIFKQ